MCLALPDQRSARGLPYPSGLLLFGLFLCVCAGRQEQRSQAVWLFHNWRWIRQAWLEAKGKAFVRAGTPSQSSISRILAALDPKLIARLMTQFGRDGFLKEWGVYVEKSKAKKKAKNARCRKRAGRVSRRTYAPAKKRLPQYCLDGKSRSGCVSKLTGRTEIDLTIFSPETSQILGHATLPDKVGEQTAAFAMIFAHGRELPAGIFTGDAGITSPEVVRAIRTMGHGYLLGIKGNAGKVYDVIADFNWESVVDKHLFFNEGHGRQEIRTVKSVSVSDFGSSEFDKYADVARVFYVRSDVYRPKEKEWSSDTRVFISDRRVAAFSAHEALTYIRDHWKQESYHWIKDAVLGEDDCATKTPNGSQTLGLVRAAVVKAATAVAGSVKKFVDHFSASPEKTYTQGL